MKGKGKAVRWGNQEPAHNRPPPHALHGRPAHRASSAEQAPGLPTKPTQPRFSPALSHLGAFQISPRSILSEDRRRQDRAPRRGTEVFRQLANLRLLPGRIPMVTPPSAGSNARADAGALAVLHCPPMGIPGTR